MARGNPAEIKLDEKCHPFFKQKMISNHIFDQGYIRLYIFL